LIISRDKNPRFLITTDSAMKNIRLAVLSVTWIFLLGTNAVIGKDEVRVVSVSKIAAAKSGMRDKTATDWMPVEQLRKLNDTKRGQKQQIIFFEYHAGRDMWRGVYTDKLMLQGFSWWTFGGENEMEAKVNEEIKKGLQPAFIGRSGIWYSMLFVNPDQYAEARKILDELGVGEPKLK
jgi:hypothetical protein